MSPETLGSFSSRHIGPDKADRDAMLAAIGVASLEALIDQTIPPGIRARAPLDLPEGDSESAYLRRLRDIATTNRLARSYIGLGYHDTVTPSVPPA